MGISSRNGHWVGNFTIGIYLETIKSAFTSAKSRDVFGAHRTPIGKGGMKIMYLVHAPPILREVSRIQTMIGWYISD